MHNLLLDVERERSEDSENSRHYGRFPALIPPALIFRQEGALSQHFRLNRQRCIASPNLFSNFLLLFITKRVDPVRQDDKVFEVMTNAHDGADNGLVFNNQLFVQFRHQELILSLTAL